MSKGERRKRKKRDDRIEARLEDVLDESRLSKLLTNTIDTIEDNKTQIFEIYQNTRTEVDEMQTRLAELKMEVAETIERVDALTEKERKARLRLTAINAHISEYAGDVIQKAYEEVTQLQVTLGIEREKEQQMRVERDKIEIRLRNLHTMVIRAERMSLAIGSVLSYLSTQVSGVIWKIEAVQKDKFIGARIIKATEEERYRISRELHDGPAQDLANLLFMTSVTERLMERMRPHVADAVNGMIRVAVQKQMALFTYQLQQTLNEQAPQLVEEVLEYNIKKVLTDLKYEMKYKR